MTKDLEPMLTNHGNEYYSLLCKLDLVEKPTAGCRYRLELQGSRA